MLVIQIYLIGILLAHLGGFTFFTTGELLRLNIDEEIGVVSPCRPRHRKRLDDIRAEVKVSACFMNRSFSARLGRFWCDDGVFLTLAFGFLPFVSGWLSRAVARRSAASRGDSNHKPPGLVSNAKRSPIYCLTKLLLVNRP